MVVEISVLQFYAALSGGFAVSKVLIKSIKSNHVSVRYTSAGLQPFIQNERFRLLGRQCLGVQIGWSSTSKAGYL